MSRSNRATLERHASLAYGELRQVAGNMLATNPLWTLTATGLVHEAFIKMARNQNYHWRDHRHFVSACAQAMRHLLVDRARKKATEVHGGKSLRLPLTDAVLGVLNGNRLVALNDALEALDARQSEIVQLRFFGGLTNQEIAELIGVSRRTIQTEWRMAKAWLHRELNDETNEATTSTSESPFFRSDKTSSKRAT